MLNRSPSGSVARPRRKIGGIVALLVIGNLLAWTAALWVFDGYPVLLSTAFLAYVLGLRHAADADHIAAIDNVTRKLTQRHSRPMAVGLFFSLGHSTVVVLASIAIAATSGTLQPYLGAFVVIGGPIGTAVSALFLFAIAAANTIALGTAFRSFRRVRRGDSRIEEDPDGLLLRHGLLGRLLRPLLRLVNSSWHMYPVGFLFGLGFDTATEIGVLGISAVEASKGLPIWSILVFPALFTAGMSLVDTIDGILMQAVYGWAYAKPIRRLRYNLAITLVSVLAALVVGGIEALGLVRDALPLEGPFGDLVAAANGDSISLGLAFIAVFVAGGAAFLIASRRDPMPPPRIRQHPSR